jgi:hypothetical protein
MSSDIGAISLAADHLMKEIDPPSAMAVSIGTFFRPGLPLAIRVSIRPQYSYLIQRVPERIDGFEVLREVAKAPTAS